MAGATTSSVSSFPLAWTLSGELRHSWGTGAALPRHRGGSAKGNNSPSTQLQRWIPFAVMAAVGLILLVLSLQGHFSGQAGGMALSAEQAVLEAPEEILQCLQDAVPGPAAAAAGLGEGEELRRQQFPPSFVFGTATSAFQIEGGVADGGRGPSIWDNFTHTEGKISDKSDADVADDSYHKVEEDVALMKSMGVQSYRFSISWSRVIPGGSGPSSEDGIAYYNKLIDALLKQGITPAVTLYHWDLPQALQDKYGGWLSPNVVEDFANYATLCFESFGDRVKLWITLNEPQQVTVQGYGGGTFAPGRCSDRSRCAEGDSGSEPYLAGHHLLLAHAAAVKAYRANFQNKQGGRIGITLDCTYHFPLDQTSESDRAAANRAMEFQLPWFADPIMNGSYPHSMAKSLGSRLPQFTQEQATDLLGSTDFLGLNFYTASYAKKSPWGPPAKGQENPWADRQVETQDKDAEGNPIGESSGSSWLKVVPKSIYHMLVWIHERYPSLPIMITENGISQDGSLPVPELLCDKQRIHYFRDHLTFILKAIREGVPLEAYYAWSLIDNFEWASGYTQRFGIHYVDFSEPSRPRQLKASALWWSKFLKNTVIQSLGAPKKALFVSKVSQAN